MSSSLKIKIVFLIQFLVWSAHEVSLDQTVEKHDVKQSSLPIYLVRPVEDDTIQYLKSKSNGHLILSKNDYTEEMSINQNDDNRKINKLGTLNNPSPMNTNFYQSQKPSLMTHSPRRELYYKYNQHHFYPNNEAYDDINQPQEIIVKQSAVNKIPLTNEYVQTNAMPLTKNSRNVQHNTAERFSPTEQQTIDKLHSLTQKDTNNDYTLRPMKDSKIIYSNPPMQKIQPTLNIAEDNHYVEETNSFPLEENIYFNNKPIHKVHTRMLQTNPQVNPAHKMLNDNVMEYEDKIMEQKMSERRQHIFNPTRTRREEQNQEFFQKFNAMKPSNVVYILHPVSENFHREENKTLLDLPKSLTKFTLLPLVMANPIIKNEQNIINDKSKIDN